MHIKEAIHMKDKIPQNPAPVLWLQIFGIKKTSVLLSDGFFLR